MNGFQKRREAKKKELLQTAIELFSANGVKNANIADIAKRANVSQVSIYNFFGSKDNLAKLAFIQFMEQKMEQSERVLDTALPFPEKFRELILESDKAGQDLSEEFFQSSVWNDPAIQSYYQEHYHARSVRLFLNLIEQGKKEGCVDVALSTDAILLYIGMFKNALAQPGVNKTTRQDFGKLFFYGILGREANL